MITYKDSLQNKVKNLQKLIDEINESNIEGIKISGGVIIDLTVNSISTKNITSDEANINSLTTSNITNSNLIQTNGLRATDYMRIYGAGSYVHMRFNGKLYIDESVYLSTNKFFVQNNATFLFDTNATLYFSREHDNVLHGTNTFKCVAHGFYNPSNGYALISTGFVLIPLGDTRADWAVLLGFVINGINFDCIYYDGLGNNGSSYTTSIPGNTGNNPLTPPIMGNVEMCNVTSNIYKNRIDTDTRFYNSVFCYAHKMSLNGTSKPVYIVSNHESTDVAIDINNLCVKFIDVLMKKA